MTAPLSDKIAQLEYVIREQMAEIDQLRAEVDGLVDWIAGEKDALSALQAVYVDPRSTPTNRIRAASSAIPYERSKPASVVVQVDFREQVKSARLRTLELRKAEWARQEAQPQLDLEAPAILGHDGEGEAADPAT
jgi:hypothetical protein